MDNYPEISNIRKSIKSHYPVSDESIGLSVCITIGPDLNM